MEKKVKRDLLLDFTHSYSMDWVGAHPELQYIDCSGIGGTDMYCTPEAEEELQKILEKYPLRGIHFFDSGNYHYMSRLFTKRMDRPYQLVFFDNHTDMQPSMIPDLLSCGAWANRFSNTFSTTSEVPCAIVHIDIICACISVGKPGYG